MYQLGTTPATSTILPSSPSLEILFYKQVTGSERLAERQIPETEYYSTRLHTVRFNPIASIVPQLDN
jgi:hypothetical protein